MKACLRVSVAEKQSEWLRLGCHAALSSDALLQSDIWKHTMTHLVEGRRGQITVGLVDGCFKQAGLMEDVKYWL